MTQATIGLNLLYLAPGDTGGTEIYARALVPELVRAWPDASWVVFASREAARDWRAAPWAPGVRLVGLPVSGRSRVRRVLAEQTLLPVAALRYRIDLLHSLATTQPILAPGLRTVTTIHDVIYRRHPDAHVGILTHGMAALVPLAAHRADRVITISQAAARDIGAFLRLAPEKIDVIPEGPGMEPGVAPTPEDELRARLELGAAPLVFSPSAKRPHKNLARLIEAMAFVPGATLVIPGYWNAHEDELRTLAAARGLGEHVRFPGWVSDADLEGLYAACRCVCLPSLAEGFGLPVLEAMRRGVPVACADATALPEVAGGAALLFDPYDVAAIADAVTRLLGDPALRDDLTRRGRERAAEFTWQRTATQTVATYRRVLASS